MYTISMYTIFIRHPAAIYCTFPPCPTDFGLGMWSKMCARFIKRVAENDWNAYTRAATSPNVERFSRAQYEAQIVRLTFIMNFPDVAYKLQKSLSTKCHFLYNVLILKECYVLFVITYFLHFSPWTPFFYIFLCQKRNFQYRASKRLWGEPI